jgi:hypothetical protein
VNTGGVRYRIQDLACLGAVPRQRFGAYLIASGSRQSDGDIPVEKVRQRDEIQIDVVPRDGAIEAI